MACTIIYYLMLIRISLCPQLAIILSTLNFIIPFVTRLMVSYEKHLDEGSMQRSLYIKITLFRWVNTAIITRIITPFVSSLGVDKIDMINTINALLISGALWCLSLCSRLLPSHLFNFHFAQRNCYDASFEVF